ncbi:dihydrolipoamide acetyltransferase family protein [Nocardia sp. NPDC003963]
MLELTDIRMPHMGSVEFALLTEWLVKPGEAVAEGDPLCEVSTDKVDTEVESPAAGILIEYVAAVDQEVPVGEMIARFAPIGSDPAQVAQAIDNGCGTDAESATTSSPAAPAVLPSATPSPVSDGVADAVAAGRVSEPPTDSLVLAASWFPHVNYPPPGARRTAIGTARLDNAGATTGRSLLTGERSEPLIPAGYADVDYTADEHTRLRKAIAKNLTESWNTAPQLTAQVDIDFTAVSVARAKINRQRLASGRGKLSFLPFVAVALCRAVALHPVINATFTETHLIRWQTVNLGIAVDTPDGLVVPVIRNAQNLTLEGLSDAIAGVSDAVTAGTSKPEDLAGGTITISNSGSIGGVVSTPILTKPQVASLGLPAIIRTPVARKSADGTTDLLAFRPLARIGLTFDHRAFDGAQALRALLEVQAHLENWPTQD